jgi:hypothetical protein
VQAREEAPHAIKKQKERNHTSRNRNSSTTGLSAEHHPSQKTNAEAHKSIKSFVKNMQRGSRYQHNEMPKYGGIEVPWSQCLEGLGIVMKDNDSTDTGLA